MIFDILPNLKAQSLIYVSNARLPTEKAHGHQIVKMCEAFGKHGLQVELWHPRRFQPDPAIAGQDVFEYYGVDKSFAIKALPNLDVVRLERFLPAMPFRALFMAQNFAWGLSAAAAAKKSGSSLYFARDAAIAYWLASKGLPTIYEAHAVHASAGRRLAQKAIDKEAVRAVVALTSHIKDRLVSLGARTSKVVVLPDGVDLERFDRLPTKEECRVKNGLPADRQIIGYVGRFETMAVQKGVGELVRATATLHAQGIRPHLVCVGGPMHKVPDYLALASTLGLEPGYLRFVDRVPPAEVPGWIKACDVVTIPLPRNEFSMYFTSPLKLFEYMAAGVPVVASDLPSLRDVLTTGENAWLVNPDDPSALAEGLKSLLGSSSLRQRLSSRALSDVQHCTWYKRVESLLQFVAGSC